MEIKSKVLEVTQDNWVHYPGIVHIYCRILLSITWAKKKNNFTQDDPDVLFVPLTRLM